MKREDTLRYRRVRDALVRVLDDHGELSRPAVMKLIRRDEYCRRLSDGALRECVTSALWLYNEDFWQDPTTHKWTLARKARLWLAQQRAENPPGPAVTVRRDTTAAGRVHEALEARDGG